MPIVVVCPFCRSATATIPCQHCKSELPPPSAPRRLDRLWVAVALVGVMIGLVAAAGRETAAAPPATVAFYVALIGAAVAALWFVARAFARRR